MKNIHYDSDTISQVRKTDMVSFLAHHSGFSFKLQGSDYRCKEHNSLVVKGDKIRWYWNSKGIGGAGVIDYLAKIEGLTFSEAIGVVLNSGCTARIITPPVTSNAEMPRIFSLPYKGKMPYTRLYDYLCKTRGIDDRILTELIAQGKIYQDNRNNAVFVGFDENNFPRYACVRGTNPKVKYRGECQGSDKRYGFSMQAESSDTLYVFESPIDALSHATLENLRNDNSEAWKRDNLLSLGGTSDIALGRYLNYYGGIRKLVLCLDNDEAGKMAAQIIVAKYRGHGLEVSNVVSCFKDFNEDLIEYRSEHKNEMCLY